MNDLPAPEVVRCSFVDGFPHRVAVLVLRWPPSAISQTRPWHLPAGLTFHGRFPQQFAIQVLRRGIDSYSLAVCWDDLYLRWSALTRAQILGSSLTPLLDALSTDVFYLLDQPILTESDHPLARCA